MTEISFKIVKTRVYCEKMEKDLIIWRDWQTKFDVDKY